MKSSSIEMAAPARGNHVWVGTETGILKGINLQKKQATNYTDVASLSRGQEVTVMCWGDPHESEVLLGCRDGTVRVFSTDKSKFTEIRECFGGEGAFRGLGILDNAIITCVQSGLLKVWKEGACDNVRHTHTHTHTPTAGTGQGEADTHTLQVHVRGKQTHTHLLQVQFRGKQTHTQTHIYICMCIGVGLNSPISVFVCISVCICLVCVCVCLYICLILLCVSQLEVQVGAGVERMRQCDAQRHRVGTGGKENDLKIWDLQRAEEPLFKAKNLRNDWLDLRVPVWIRDLHFIPGSDKVVTCTSHHQVRVYDPSCPQRRPVLEVLYEEDPLTALSVTPDGRSVVVGNSHGNIGVIDLRKGRLLRSLKGNAGSLRSIQCHTSLPLVASCGLDRFLRIHNLHEKELLHKVCT
ncbi:hypothetical protein FKM82_024991 [Ascaphus truei]